MRESSLLQPGTTSSGEIAVAAKAVGDLIAHLSVVEDCLCIVHTEALSADPCAVTYHVRTMALVLYLKDGTDIPLNFDLAAHVHPYAVKLANVIPGDDVPSDRWTTCGSVEFILLGHVDGAESFDVTKFCST